MAHQPDIIDVLTGKTADGRRCGECTLCCKVLPMSAASEADAVSTKESMAQAGFDVPEMIPVFDKAAGECCPHQRDEVGCSVYDRRPFGCRYWMCAWLSGNDTAEIERPDCVHYVIDPSIDYVTQVSPSGDRVAFPAIQIWVDPDYPDAHRDPALRAFIDRRGQDGGTIAIIRYSNIDGLVLVPPSVCDDGKWHEQRDKVEIDRSRKYNLTHVSDVLSGKAQP